MDLIKFSTLGLYAETPVLRFWLEHINLTGDYLWRSSTRVGAGKFRPLRLLPPA